MNPALLLSALLGLTTAMPSPEVSTLNSVEQSGAITSALLDPTPIDYPSSPRDLPTALTLAKRAGCIIRGYSGNTCNGANLYAYDSSPTPNTCRSCVKWDGSHSFSISGSCTRYFEFWSSGEGACGNRRLAAGGPPVGCFNVNTGLPWITGYPCFGP